MDKAYDPKLVEQTIYSMWETGSPSHGYGGPSGYFAPKKEEGKIPFTVILPPPNANADLHLGHAMYVVEDIMIRYHRMKGDPTLWLPGADHAGFETQYVFEKYLSKQGKSRFDYSREDLYKMIWDFVHENRGKMENQLRRLGFSLDWSRNVFALDPKIVAIVYKTFKKLFDDGLVYRSARLVNYCTRCGTGFSDLEVKHEETVSKLYYINYPLVDATGNIMVATTRPETMFGDQAIAVNPKDKRYKDFVGKMAHIPISGRPIPIIADSIVKKDFGTGAVKITPAHDENDFATGKKHNLPMAQVIGFNGKMMAVPEVPPQFHNLSVVNAREAVINELLKPEIGLLDHIDDNHAMVKAACYKCGRVIEPLPLQQWYIKVRPLADVAIKAIKEKKITFVPKRFEKHATRWLTDFHDWNISRQIVWGMRIPAWSCDDCHEWTVTEGDAPSTCSKCNSTKLTQDIDTFDTWFSSGQWPFATLQATSDKQQVTSNKENLSLVSCPVSPVSDFDYFYPTSVMETGYDILPWWVCRMAMLGLYRTSNVPFKTVYLHGLVRDVKGQKMSKSKGNVINPLEMIDKYGADALRMALIFGTAPGNDQAMSEDKIRGMRNFANKLWNICRFIQMNIETAGGTVPLYDEQMHKELSDTHDKRIITELNMMKAAVTKYMENYRYSDAAQRIYDFAWHRVADVHLEKNKERFKVGDKQAIAVLLHVYSTILMLLHPFMPFVTEEIWSKLPRQNDKPLIVSVWPV
jgi:valyl-tRNA synthetase